jgi:hypothetical protein
MKRHYSYVEMSREYATWGRSQVEPPFTHEDVTLGSALRMAASMEGILFHLGRIANVMECGNARAAARAIIKMADVLTKPKPRSKRKRKGGKK